MASSEKSGPANASNDNVGNHALHNETANSSGEQTVSSGWLPWSWGLRAADDVSLGTPHSSGLSGVDDERLESQPGDYERYNQGPHIPKKQHEEQEEQHSDPKQGRVSPSDTVSSSAQSAKRQVEPASTSTTHLPLRRHAVSNPATPVLSHVTPSTVTGSRNPSPSVVLAPAVTPMQLRSPHHPLPMAKTHKHAVAQLSHSQQPTQHAHARFGDSDEDRPSGDGNLFTDQRRHGTSEAYALGAADANHAQPDSNALVVDSTRSAFAMMSSRGSTMDRPPPPGSSFVDTALSALRRCVLYPFVIIVTVVAYILRCITVVMSYLCPCCCRRGLAAKDSDWRFRDTSSGGCLQSIGSFVHSLSSRISCFGAKCPSGACQCSWHRWCGKRGKEADNEELQGLLSGSDEMPSPHLKSSLPAFQGCHWANLIRISFALLVALSIGALLFFLADIEALFVDGVEWVQTLHGVQGPIILCVAMTVSAALLLPCLPLTLSAGFLYGVWVGTLVVLIASNIAALVGFLIARYAARDTVTQCLGMTKERRSSMDEVIAGMPPLSLGTANKAASSPDATTDTSVPSSDHPHDKQQWYQAIDRSIRDDGFKVVFLVRLSPLHPFPVCNYLFGITAVSLWHHTLASFIAMIPTTIMEVYFGTAVHNVHHLVSGSHSPSHKHSPTGGFGGLVPISNFTDPLDSAASAVADVMADDNVADSDSDNVSIIFFWIGLVVTLAASAYLTYWVRRRLAQELHRPSPSHEKAVADRND